MSISVVNNRDREEVVDEILQNKSTMQYILLTSICTVYISITWHEIATEFLILYEDVFCNTPNITDPCDSNCTEMEFLNPEKTFASRYRLVCEFEHWKLGVVLLTYTGQSMGALSYGMSADTHGRRPMLFLFHGSFIMFSIFFTLVDAFWTFCVQRLLLSWSVGGCNVFCYLILLEEFSSKHRDFVIGGMNATYIISAALASISVYYLYWRNVVLNVALFSILSLPVVFFATESPSWLLEKGRLKESISTLKFLTDAPYSSPDIRETLATATKNSGQELSIFQLFSTRDSCYKIFTIFFGNILVFSYEGSYNDIQHITHTENIYMHPIMIGCFHMGVLFIWVLFSKCYGRIIIITVANIIAVIGFCILLFTKQSEFHMAIGYITGSFVFVSWMTTVLCATETIPVMLRGTTIGVMFMLFYAVMAFQTVCSQLLSAWIIKVMSLVAIIIVTVLYSFFPETKRCLLFQHFPKQNETKTLWGVILRRLRKLY